MPGIAVWISRNVFRRAHTHHRAATRTTFWPHVNHPVGGFDDVEIVLDHHNRVACVAQLVQHFQQQVNVGKERGQGSGLAFCLTAQ